MTTQPFRDRLAEVKGVGDDLADRIAERFTAAELAAATADELRKVKGVGAVTASRILQQFQGGAATDAAEVSTASTSATEAAAAGVPAEPLARANDDTRTLGELSFGEQALVLGQALGAAVRAGASALRDELPELRQAIAEAGRAVVILGREIARSVVGRDGSADSRRAA